MLDDVAGDSDHTATLFAGWGGDLSVQWLATLYIAAVSFAVSVVLARLLGVHGFGTYSYILSLAGIFLILQDGGYRMLLYREGINSRTNSLPFAIGHVLIVTVAGVVLVLLVRPTAWLTVSVALVCMGLVALAEFVSSDLKGAGRFRHEAIWRVLVRSATAFGVVWVVWIHSDSGSVGIFLAWAVALLVVLMIPLFRGQLCWPKLHFRADLIRANIAFLTIDMATILYFRSDIVLLEYLAPQREDVGQYAVAYRVLEGVILFATPVAVLAFRALRLRWMEGSGFAKLFAMLLGAMLLAAIIIVVLSALWGEVVVILVFGPSYLVAGSLLFWLSLALIFLLPNYILTQGAIAMGRETSYAWVALGTVIINIALNLLWIPRFGAMGAAWATIAAEGCLFLGLGWTLLHGWRSSKL